MPFTCPPVSKIGHVCWNINALYMRASIFHVWQKNGSFSLGGWVEDRACMLYSKFVTFVPYMSHVYFKWPMPRLMDTCSIHAGMYRAYISKYVCPIHVGMYRAYPTWALLQYFALFRLFLRVCCKKTRLRVARKHGYFDFFTI